MYFDMAGRFFDGIMSKKLTIIFTLFSEDRRVPYKMFS
jgi:hypothetical protein